MTRDVYETMYLYLNEDGKPCVFLGAGLLFRTQVIVAPLVEALCSDKASDLGNDVS